MSEAIFTCPDCNGRGEIDEDQQFGRVSILCDNCGWHGYVTDQDTNLHIEGAHHEQQEGK